MHGTLSLSDRFDVPLLPPVHVNNTTTNRTSNVPKQPIVAAFWPPLASSHFTRQLPARHVKGAGSLPNTEWGRMSYERSFLVNLQNLLFQGVGAHHAGDKPHICDA